MHLNIVSTIESRLAQDLHNSEYTQPTSLFFVPAPLQHYTSTFLRSEVGDLRVDEMSVSWEPPKDWKSRPICVLGGGVLGRRIAACFVAAGRHVRVRDPSAKARDDAVEYIKTNISSYTVLSGRDAGTCEAVESFEDAVKDCWLVIEAVPEVLSIKEDTFLDLEKNAPRDCIFASNSSSYKTSELVGKIQDETKARVLNTHFMMPPEVCLLSHGFMSQY